MFILPILYILFFGIAVFYLLKGEADALLLFIIFGLPIYITSLSIAFMYGFKGWIPVMQSFKEVIVLLTFLFVFFKMKKKPQFCLLDWLVTAYFLYTLSYVFLPVGTFSFTEKLLSFKSIAFFPFIYFTGRLIDPEKINLNKYFQYTCIVAIAAAAVVACEVIVYTHLQTITGYADYMYYYFNQEPAGHHGLSWTFEVENGGPKRFASFFANPLDHASGTLVTIAALVALITTDTKRIKVNRFLIITFLCTLVSIIFALSRASFASYFIILLTYAYVTRRRAWIKAFYYGLVLILLAGIVWIKGDIYDFIINTLNFSNSSSASHIVEWLDGIQSLSANPLGLGLGASGRIATTLGINVGGENELIIIGVQAGLVALILYFIIYVYLIRFAAAMVRTYKGKARKLALFILLIKLGLIIPFLTAEAESYVYISYITWFLSGLMVNIKYGADDYRNRYPGPETRKDGPENNIGGALQTIQVTGR